MQENRVRAEKEITMSLMSLTAVELGKKIKAKELWDNIVHNNWLSAEPGLMFWDNQNDYSLSNNYPEFKNESCNPSIY